MRTHIILTAIAVLAGLTVAAIAGAWSISHKTAGKGEPTNAAAPVSPHHIMVEQANSLPAEYWRHPY